MTDTGAVIDAEKRSRPIAYALLALYLVGLPLAIWSGWGMLDKGPALNGARLLATGAILVWAVALNVSARLGKRRRRSSPLRAVSDDDNVIADAAPRLKAVGGLLFCAWLLPSVVSIAIAVIESGETWRILAAAPVMVVSTILLAQQVWRSLRGLAPQHLGAGRL